MLVELETESYNRRRYGKPWIAVVDFSEDSKGKFTFGEWIGAQGEGGILVVEGEPGDIIARGQKDFRKPRNSAPEYYQLQQDGSLGCIVAKATAYTMWRENQGKPKPTGFEGFTDSEILAEAERRGLMIAAERHA